MGWSDVDRPKSGGGRFISWEDGESVRLRIVDEEPYTTFVHKIQQEVNGEDTFRTIPATEDPDDDYIDQNSNRWPRTPQFSMRVFVYADGLDDDDDVDGEFKVLTGGNGIFKPLKQLYEQFKDIRKFDIIVTPKGKGREREYVVTASPTSFDVDLDDLRRGLEEDEALAWEALYPPTTAEQQKQMMKEANFDIAYDPAGEIAESMDINEAKTVTIGFGKHKGRTIGDVMVIDAGYLEWASEKVTSDDRVAAAARVAKAHIASIEKPAAKKQIGKPKTSEKAAPAKPAAKTKPAKGEDREALQVQVTTALNNSDIKEPMELINLIQEHGGGKTRVKDLTVAELKSLLSAIDG